MANEELGTKVPGEDEGGSSLSPQMVDEARVAKARKKGWKPLEEYDGEAADWIDAKEFLGREPLFEANRDLKRQLKQQQSRFEQDMKVISQQFAQMNDVAYQRALSELQEQRDAAIVDNDVASVRKLDEKIDSTKQAHVQQVQKQQTQQGPVETDYMKEWRKENDWFDADPELQDEAVSIGVGYMTSHQGITQEKMLKYVEDRIKKIYPEKFKKGSQNVEKEETTSQQGKETPNQVERSTAPKLGNRGKKPKITVNDLDDREREVMRTFIKRGVFKELAAKNQRSQEEEYLAQRELNG